MKRMSVAAALPVVALVCQSPLAGCETADVQSRAYEDYEASRIAVGTGDQTWLPVWLPTTATSIREEHNLDTNEVWVTFVFGPNESLPFSEACEAASERAVAPPRAVPAWWDLRVSATDSEAGKAHRLKWYRCGRGTLVIVEHEARAYYWE